MLDTFEVSKINAEKVASVNFTETGYFTKLISDYLNNDDKIVPYCSNFGNIEDFKEVIKLKSENYTNRISLVNALKEQHQKIKVSPLVSEQIELLEKETTFTVTTGHQLNLLGGPLYTIYKALSTIKLAENLKQHYPNYHFVPVFWLASEDHDFEEISTVNINGKTLKWNAEFKKDTGSIESENLHHLKNEIKYFLADFQFNLPYTQSLIDTWFNQKNSTLASITTNFIYQIFEDYPLLVIDGNSKILKTCFAPFMQKEIEEKTAFNAITKTNNQLYKSGYHRQINPREINLFYLNKNERQRIDIEKDKFRFLGSNNTFTKENLITKITAEPEKFSPNVALRPLYQEIVLPNLAYIGGAGELAYWLQLKEMFEAFKIAYPAIILRNSFILAEPKSIKKWEKLGLDKSLLFKKSDELKSIWIKENVANLPDFEEEKIKLSKQFSQLKTTIEPFDKSLVASTESALKRSLKTLDNLEKKVIKAQKRKNEHALNTIDEVLDGLFVNGNLQERKNSGFNYLVNFGKSFIDAVYSQTNCPTKTFDVISIN